MLGLQSEIKPLSRHPNGHIENRNPLQHALKNFTRLDVPEFESEETARFFQASRLLMQNCEYLPAQKLLRKVLNQAPYSSSAIFALAECARHLQQTDERLKLLKTLITLDDHPRHLLALADAFYENGADQMALDYYLQALALLSEDSPQLFSVYKNVGNIHVRAHDFESAEEYYNRAYILEPRSATLLVNFGTLAIQRERWEKAVQHFRDAVTFEPSFDAAWVGLSMVHRQFGDFDLSWANLFRALDLNPLNTTALQLALSWVVKDQRWDQVAQSLQRYLVLADQDATMSLALSQLWFLKGNLADARLELTRTLALDPLIPGGQELTNLIEAEEAKRSHGWESQLESDRENYRG